MDESPPGNGAGFVFFCKFVHKPEPMKISLPYTVCAFCLVGLFACRQGEMELLLTELDHTIENKAVYTERFNGRADSLRRALRGRR